MTPLVEHPFYGSKKPGFLPRNFLIRLLNVTNENGLGLLRYHVKVPPLYQNTKIVVRAESNIFIF